MASGISRRREAARRDGGPAYQEKRQEVIRAAATVFREKGFRGASLSDIAQELRTDRASLYYYFASKEALFNEVVQEASEANLQSALAILDSSDDAATKIGRLVRSLMDSYARHYPYLHVYIQENLNHVAADDSEWAKRMHLVNRQYHETVISIIQQGLEDGVLRPVGPAKVIAYGLMGLVNSTHQWFTPNSILTAGDVAAVYTEVLLKGLEAT